jgi:hypothetical protein
MADLRALAAGVEEFLFVLRAQSPDPDPHPHRCPWERFAPKPSCRLAHPGKAWAQAVPANALLARQSAVFRHGKTMGSWRQGSAAPNLQGRPIQALSRLSWPSAGPSASSDQKPWHLPVNSRTAAARRALKARCSAMLERSTAQPLTPVSNNRQMTIRS